MNPQEFSLHYPLFAVKKQANYLAYNLAEARLPGKGFGIPVFTTPENVVRFLCHVAAEARIMPFDRVGVFRHFLRSLPEPDTVILFDLLPDANGNLHSNRAYPANVILERFLPEGGFAWSYPVYLLKFQGSFACVQASHAGGAGNWLAVFTDSDLADRAVAADLDHLEAVPVPSSQALARVVRGLSAEIAGAAFDPPDPRRGGRPGSAMLRHQLLANLEMQI